MRNQRGITLVALVITIIVLLILAAVTIAALGGQNGILTNAARAKQENAIGNAKDVVAMAINEATNAYYIYTYVDETDTADGKVVDGDPVTTAKNFIDAAKAQVPDVEISYSGSDVVLTTKDNDPKTTSATFDSQGGIDAWDPITDAE